MKDPISQLVRLCLLHYNICTQIEMADDLRAYIDCFSFNYCFKLYMKQCASHLKQFSCSCFLCRSIFVELDEKTKLI